MIGFKHGLGSEEQSQINAFPPCIIPSEGYLIPREGQQRVKASGHGDREEPRSGRLEADLSVRARASGRDDFGVGDRAAGGCC